MAEQDVTNVNRREFLCLGAAAAAASRFHFVGEDTLPKNWSAQWVWYPGQLAAYRHARRIRLAMERCAFVGYPANFRQPQTEAWFRRRGSAVEDISLRWAAPVARVRTSIDGQGRDVTAQHATMRKGQSEIEVQIDFAQSLPCLLLEGGQLSTGAQWEASLDGKRWVAVEVGTGSDPNTLPDQPREIVVTLPVVSVVGWDGPLQGNYSVTEGRDLLLDFQETELGALRLEVLGRGNLNVQVGESVAEVRERDTQYFEQYPLRPIKLSKSAQLITLPERALRFARLSVSGEAQVRNIRFDASIWPSEQKGTFESSDEDLNVIWKTAVATLRSNMHDFYLDGIRRDGLLWHDGPLTLEAYERVFFDADLSRQTLIGETLPENPGIRDVGIIDAPMYDLIGFEREFMLRGDPSFSQMFRDRIDDILRFYESLQNESGFVNAAHVEPYGFFPDWSATPQTGPDGHGTPAYGQILLASAFSSAARLGSAWGDTTLQAHCSSKGKKLEASVRQAFWRPQAGLFTNGLNRDGTPDERFTTFAQAFAVACGIAPQQEWPAIFAFLDDESRRPAHYSLSQVVEMTAYAKAGRANSAIRRLKAAWLPIVKAGYHRFFEDIDPNKNAEAQLAMYGRKYATSLCHAWAGAAPVMAISLGILGVEPLEPGYSVCRISPQRCGLTRVAGSVPTPHGSIEVEWTGLNGQFRIPGGVHVRAFDGSDQRGPGTYRLRMDTL